MIMKSLSNDRRLGLFGSERLRGSRTATADVHRDRYWSFDGRREYALIPVSSLRSLRKQILSVFAREGSFGHVVLLSKNGCTSRRCVTKVPANGREECQCDIQGVSLWLPLPKQSDKLQLINHPPSMCSIAWALNIAARDGRHCKMHAPRSQYLSRMWYGHSIRLPLETDRKSTRLNSSHRC